MDLKELRLGNTIKTVQGVLNIDMIKYDRCGYRYHEFFYDEIEPITLTEEWLFKFGFDKRPDYNYNLFKYSEVDIIIPSDFGRWQCDGINFSINKLQYVHQLQNLYFALTGEELTIEKTL